MRVSTGSGSGPPRGLRTGNRDAYECYVGSGGACACASGLHVFSYGIRSRVQLLVRLDEELIAGIRAIRRPRGGQGRVWAGRLSPCPRHLCARRARARGRSACRARIARSRPSLRTWLPGWCRHARQAKVIRVTLPTTGKRVWQCGEHTEKLEPAMCR